MANGRTQHHPLSRECAHRKISKKKTAWGTRRYVKRVVGALHDVLSGGSERSVTVYRRLCVLWCAIFERGVSLFDCMDSIQSGIFMVRQHIAICRAVHTVPCSGINGQCMPPQLQRCMHQRHTPGLSTEQEQHGHTRQQIGVLRPLRPSDLVTRMAGSK